MNQNVTTNTSVLLQNENDLMIESSQCSFINEESFIKLQAEESSIELQDYSPPGFDFPDSFDDLQNIDKEWIIIFILRFQTRFCLSDTVTDILIKFVKHVLIELDHNDQFKDFPTSLYTTRKKLGLKHQFIMFSVCPSCHKLYNVNDVEQYTI
ncbi:4912_t:CDS:2 [Funneliformis caledonium]|uniref:4912_t:CDS:1 n=1 Tax=Funneliformis caledonium TaxID=1117310 RepID=A0A9N9CEQ1_9GLOM|nr:4912_t:CDS:2 [Funneliformis caledonium]